jgi:hypothetical protein
VIEPLPDDLAGRLTVTKLNVPIDESKPEEVFMRWGISACSRLSPAKLTAALALLISATAVAHGQSKAETRAGFWIGFGLGYGSLGCDGCNDRASARAGFFKMGGTLNRQWLLGGEIEFWAKDSDQGETTLTYTNFSPVVSWYPTPNSGFFLRGGIGLARVRLQTGDFVGQEKTVGILLGVGYDAGQHFSLTPYFNISSGSFKGGNANMFQLGVGLTWH